MTYAEHLAQLEKRTKKELVEDALSRIYNDFLSDCADYKDSDKKQRSTGKRVPYIGWFWRDLDWSNLERIPIGNCGEFIGFMRNNKWDYPERALTREEAERVVAIVDEARDAWNRGGSLDQMIADRDAKLDELHDYLQTLEIES